MFTLASTSARRMELLRTLSLKFDIQAATIDEEAIMSMYPEDLPETLVHRLAQAKAREVFYRKDQHYPVLAADTIVVLDQKIFGKPRDPEEAKAMLIQLCGRTHEVLTAVSLIDAREETTFVSFSKVRFRPFDQFTEKIIDASIISGSALDKAGAYGIQEEGRLLVTEIKGDFYSIMGLPICEVYALMMKKGWI